MSTGDEFDRRLHEAGMRSPWNQWMVDHPKEVLEAYVSVGALRQDHGAFNPFWYIPEPKLVCGAEHPTLFTCTDGLRRGSLVTPLTCTEPRDHSIFWHTAQNGTVRWP